MIGLREVMAWRRKRVNYARVTSVGAGTRLDGTIDRRAAAADVIIGSGCLVQGQLIVERNESRLEIGDNTFVGGGTIIDCALSIVVERDVLISYSCIISDCDNHSIYPELRVRDVSDWMKARYHDWTHSAMAPVRICQGAWIGAGSIIIKGVTVGAGAVVGAGSVVTRDVPPRTIAAGNPARVVREIGPLPGVTA